MSSVKVSPFMTKCNILCAIVKPVYEICHCCFCRVANLTYDILAINLPDVVDYDTACVMVSLYF